MNRGRPDAWKIAAATWMVLAVASAPLWAGPAEMPRDAVTVLDENSFWRWHETSRTPVISAGAAKADGEGAPRRKPLPGLYVDSAPPPAGWRQPDFDDSVWPRGNGRDFKNLIFSKLHIAVACLRGKFACGWPSTAAGSRRTPRGRGGHEAG